MNNEPLSGATVSTSTGGYTAQTDSQGNFSLPNVTPGTYSITAVKSGYRPLTKSVTVGTSESSVSNFVLSPEVWKEYLISGSFNTSNFEFWAGHVDHPAWGVDRTLNGDVTKINYELIDLLPFGRVQRIILSSASVNSGLVQIVRNLPVGKPYKLSGYAYQQYPGYRAYLHIDHSGAATMPTTGVPFANTCNQWNYIEINGTTSSQMAVWGWVDYISGPIGYVYFDNFSLKVLE